MSVLAGLDIGNSTTEIVLAEVDATGSPRILGAAQRPTRGLKGSPESLAGAAALLNRIERRAGHRADAVAVPELAPVRTFDADFPAMTSETAGIVRLDGPNATTPAGAGFGAGMYVPLADLADPPGTAPVVVSVPAGVDFERAAERLRDGLARGWTIAGVLVAQDDGVLIGNRVPELSVPVVDEIDLNGLALGQRVALEVARDGRTLARLADPVALARALGLDSEKVEGLVDLARQLADERSAALAVTDGPTMQAKAERASVHVRRDGEILRLPLPAELAAAATLRPGTTVKLVLDGDEHPACDVFIPDLSALEHGSWLRHGLANLRTVPLALLAPGGAAAGVESALTEYCGRPVTTVGSEAAAAHAGALTTRGAPEGAAVCDLGGGTVDCVDAVSQVAGAGGGDLLTLAVALVLGVPRGVAEHAKRGAAMRVEAPQIVHYEDGTREFLERPAPSHAVGRLCVRGPVGRLMAFSDRMAPEEWRAARLALKDAVLGASVQRCFASLSERPTSLLVCGGAAMDREIVQMLSDRLRDRRIAVGRADVLGSFGPRYAVAVGSVQRLTAGVRDGRVDAAA